MSETARYRIESGIPLPRRISPGLTSTLRCMQPGDSVFVAGMVPADLSGRASHLKQEGYRFLSRTQAGGVRIWCIEAPAGASA